MRLRTTDYLGSRLSKLLVLAIALGAPSAARAQAFQPWTTVGSAGTVDESSTSLVTLDGPNALVKKGSATVRYNVVAVDGLFSSHAIGMRVRYRATQGIAVGRDDRVLVRLIRVNQFTGQSATLLVLDSKNFSPSPDFETRGVGNCPAPVGFDFSNNVYYIEAQISKQRFSSGVPAVQSIEVAADPCLQ
jgi:hypothetical protein